MVMTPASVFLSKLFLSTFSNNKKRTRGLAATQFMYAIEVKYPHIVWPVSGGACGCANAECPRNDGTTPQESEKDWQNNLRHL